MIAGRYRPFLISSFLTLMTLAVYWQVINSDFINLDDPSLVYNNPYVKKGVTWEGLRWASSADLDSDSPHSDFWIPATLLSHLITSQIFGMEPWGHHLVNLVLHLFNTLLLFGILYRMTGGLWPSAFVAALFAVHPLHVESVAWVTERKDVLSGLFFFLTLLSYIWYIDRPNLNRYLVVVLTFTLGLMSKPMLVTLPFVLLLLDCWPLNRLSLSDLRGPSSLNTVWKLVREKIPLFILTIGFSMTTYLSMERTEGGLALWERLPFWSRVGNSFQSYASYIHKMVWPTDLAVFYPHPEDMISISETIGPILLLMSITLFVIWRVRQQPYLAIGWFWYLGMLVPVIGLLQNGNQSMADRYTYLPLVGLFIIIAWGVPDLFGRWQFRRVLPILASGLLFLLIISTSKQVSYWRNSVSLFEHTLTVTERNYLAHTALGMALSEQNKAEEAINHFEQSLQINPTFAYTYHAMGIALAKVGRTEEAALHISEALKLKPDYAGAHYSFGVESYKAGKIEEAMDHYFTVIDINPDHAGAHYNLGHIYAEQGDITNAIERFQKAVLLNPKSIEFNNNLAEAYRKGGMTQEAMKHFKAVLRLDATDVMALTNLGVTYADMGQTEKAVTEYQTALRLDQTYLEAHYNLGLALQEQRRWQDAVQEYQATLRLQPDYWKASNNLANIYARQGRIEEAVEQFHYALRFNPDQVEMHYNLGVLYKLLGRLDEARKHYNQVLQLDPNSTTARDALKSLNPENASSPE